VPVPRHALLLTAGLGTRLRPLTLVRAKPAIPVGGVPLVRRIVSWLVANGVTDLVANLHHLPATLTGVLGDGSDLGASVRYSWEQPVVLGSAGGPRLALPIVGADRFFILNGDTLTDVDLHALAAAHASSGALVTMALIPNPDPQKYGGVQLAGDRTVAGFLRAPATNRSFHFVGVQLVEAAAFLSLPAGQVASSVGGVYDELMSSRPGSVKGFVADGASFVDIGTVADYWRIARVSGATTAAGLPPDPPQLAPDARLTRSVVWDHVRIGAGATVDECIVTDNVSVPPGASHHRQILLSTAAGDVSAIPFWAPGMG
jgi:NDP-sugar pyrophosphorylase family protein